MHFGVPAVFFMCPLVDLSPVIGGGGETANIEPGGCEGTRRKDVWPHELLVQLPIGIELIVLCRWIESEVYRVEEAR
jgi:hypothetical protein